ncbi:MAG: decarboxylase [Ferruginibacter sp.]|nr:decarboxylase [Ferruginibacter sp.]
MTLHELNKLPTDKLRSELYRCCGSTNWVNRMIPLFPMEDLVELMETAEQQWNQCSETDWKEAFANHPAIGDVEALQKKFAATAQWASDEQVAVNAAPPTLIADLAAANAEYEKKFGYIFIVCATGKTAAEMLQILKQRLLNPPGIEIKIAMDEQNKITLLRLQKLVA